MLGFALIIIIMAQSHAQDQNIFNKATSHYINGDAIVIGNHILSAHSSKAHNDFSLLNDQIKMQYVDIDGKGSTFSSSSASLELDDSDASLVSATLYWAAVYPFVKGTKRQRSDEIIYYGSGDRVEPVNRVLFRTPGSKSYEEVNGTVLFDGIDKKGYEDSAPYFCYADVTEIINQSGQMSGEYMVANIKATEGFVSGGSAAGWFLFLVYESENLPPKHISSFHGFASINDNAVDVELTDFKTVESGEIKASIYAAALEGDSKLYQDRMEILKPSNSSFVPLSGKLRPLKNFFSGKITVGDLYFSNRYPNSTNALGFDLLKIDAPQDVFYNNQSETKLRFSTKADRYYAFFAAFSIEINDIFQLSKEAISEDSIVETPETIQTESQELAPVETVKKEETEAAENQTDDKPDETKQDPPTKTVNKPAETLTEAEIAILEKRIRRQEMTIPGVRDGYHLITNVFSKPSYARRWEEFVRSKGYDAYTFINPRNNWHYVSAYSNIDLKEVYKAYKKLVKLEYFEEIWMFKINMD